MMELSTRLQAVADFVTAGYKLADIGTDHAYIPIALVEQNRIPGAIAMDINEGPLQRAGEHIAENKMVFSLLHTIETQLGVLGITEVPVLTVRTVPLPLQTYNSRQYLRQGTEGGKRTSL